MSATGITGGGSGYAALLAHAEGALYGTELGSVTLKRIGFFCFPIRHSTHTTRPAQWLPVPRHFPRALAEHGVRALRLRKKGAGSQLLVLLPPLLAPSRNVVGHGRPKSRSTRPAGYRASAGTQGVIPRRQARFRRQACTCRAAHACRADRGRKESEGRQGPETGRRRSGCA